MDDSLARWLELREPHDWAARDTALVDGLVRALPDVPALRVVDLGTGTGSNLRYLMRRLPVAQEWLLVDKSPGVLRWTAQRTSAWAAAHGLQVEPAGDGFTVRGDSVNCRVCVRQQDLDLPIERGLFDDRHLVTGAALLDLVSDTWIREVADRCREARAAALFVLTYNGQTAFEPHDAGDDLARDLLNAHQLRDKGLGGPAAGSLAHARAVHWFVDAGFEVREATTDWDIDATAALFQRALIDGLAGAAVEQRPDTAATMSSWRTRRLGHLEGGRSRAIVGHHDVAAWPRPR
ncbi:MAG TPA: class I SAM-dependent methyltransferase [Patescibacteria group bacterium]|nr:class I SAM-dependent methyltransferase [Patescibacteria group bacterium]